MATLVDKYFSKPDFDAIEAAVAKSESSTGGEIAVEITARCRNWMFERSIHALVMAVACGVAALFFTRENNWGMYYNFTQTTLWAAVGFVVGFLAWGQVLRRRARRQKVVWLRALEQFGKLDPVRGLAGVLIFVSLEEDEAALVADKGIASKVTPDYWQSLSWPLVEAMRQGQHAEGIIKTIETVGAEMAKHFPHESNDENELPDRPTIVE